MVIASDRYSAADGAEQVEVDYEELPAIVDPHKSMATDAPIIREDIADKDNVGHGKRTHPNHIFTWEAGDKAAADAAFASAEVTVREEILNPRVHPCPARDVRLRRVVRQGHGPADGLHDVAGAASGAHRGRDAVRHSRKQDPHRRRRHRRRLRQQGPGLSGLCRRDRGVDRDRRADQSGSSRASTTFPRPASPATITASASSRPTRTVASRRCASRALADHGAFNSHVSATKLPAGLFSICTGSYAIPKAYCRVDAVYTNKAPGGVAYRCSLRVTEAVYLIERMIDVLAQKLGLDKAEIRRRNFVKAEQFPYTTCVRLDARQRQLPRRAGQGVEGGRLRRPAPRAGREARQGRADGHRHLARSPRSSAPDPPRSATSSASGSSTAATSASIRPAARSRGSGTMSQGQGHATTYAQIIATELGPVVGRNPDRGRRHRQGAVRRGHLGLALDAGRRRRRRDGGAQDPREGAEDRRAPAGGGRRRSRMGGRPVQGQGQSEPGQDDEGDRDGGAHEQPARRHGEGARRDRILRSAQHDVSVRRVRLRGRHRPLHRRDQGPALLRARTIAARASTR